MTNEALLKIVNEGLNDKINPVTALFELKNQLIENIRLEALKTQGTKSSDISIIKRITKEVKINPLFGKTHTFSYDGIDYFGFLEGHYILASENNFGYEIASDAEKFKINTMINYSMFCNTEVEIDMADLKTACKLTKRSSPEFYIINVENQEIGFNPFFLLDALQFNDTNIVIIDLKRQYSPIMIQNKNKKTIGMVLPVRLPKKEN